MLGAICRFRQPMEDADGTWIGFVARGDVSKKKGDEATVVQVLPQRLVRRGVGEFGEESEYQGFRSTTNFNVGVRCRAVIEQRRGGPFLVQMRVLHEFSEESLIEVKGNRHTRLLMISLRKRIGRTNPVNDLSLPYASFSFSSWPMTRTRRRVPVVSRCSRT